MNVAAQRQAASNAVAIHVVIEPDAILIDHPQALNARLRQNYPQGYTLDAAHAPRITLLQCSVRAGDLDAVVAAVTRTVQFGPAMPITLRAIGYETTESAGIGVVMYVVERAPALTELAARIDDAVRPFAVSGGADASNDVPVVTLGMAHVEFVRSLKARPFIPFGFSGVNVAIDQLGDSPTARKRLWAWR